MTILIIAGILLVSAFSVLALFLYLEHKERALKEENEQLRLKIKLAESQNNRKNYHKK